VVPNGSNRSALIRRILAAERLDAVLCGLPSNVLMLSGYWPTAGASIAVATSDGRVGLLVPEAERELAQRSWAEYVETYAPAALDDLRPVDQRIISPLRAMVARFKLGKALVGWERGISAEPNAFVAPYRFGVLFETLLDFRILSVRLTDATAALSELRARKTPEEVEAIRVSCAVASIAFSEGGARLRSGMTEAEAAVRFRAPLSTAGVARSNTARADGYVWCASGAQAATVARGPASMRDRRLTPGDTVLVQCHSFVDGYWTDIARTFVMGEADARRHGWLEIVREARAAALEAIRPGAIGSDVDRAVRTVLGRHGHRAAFMHGTGHEVGFGTADHQGRPRLHPLSTDALAAGMVFTVAPAVYVAGEGAVRHGDMVLVTATGFEILTAFLTTADDLVQELSAHV
jgi:Xaa-Pro dipeptidase